jgi:hypothetical protein
MIMVVVWENRVDETAHLVATVPMRVTLYFGSGYLAT